jgi:hypothetical protein
MDRPTPTEVRPLQENEATQATTTEVSLGQLVTYVTTQETDTAVFGTDTKH